jgi:hypothetical protein
MNTPTPPTCACRHCRMVFTFAVAAHAVHDEKKLSPTAHAHAEFIRKTYPQTPDHHSLMALTTRKITR